MTLAPQGAAWQLSLHVREREREKVLQLQTIGCAAGIQRERLDFIKLNVFINS